MRIDTGTGWPCFDTYNSELGRSSPYWLQYATLHVCHINHFSKFPDISVFYVCEKAGTSRQCNVCFLFLFAVYLKMHWKFNKNLCSDHQEFKQSTERVTGSVHNGIMKSFISWVKYRTAECQVFFSFLRPLCYVRGDKWSFKNRGSRTIFVEFYEACGLVFSSYACLAVLNFLDKKLPVG